MSDYAFMPDGTVKDGPYGKDVAFFDSDGTVRDRRYGTEIGFIDHDGTIKAGRYGALLGSVSTDGTVKDSVGQILARVHAPEILKKGALRILWG